MAEQEHGSILLLADSTVDCELNVPSRKGDWWIMIGAGSKHG